MANFNIANWIIPAVVFFFLSLILIEIGKVMPNQESKNIIQNTSESVKILSSIDEIEGIVLIVAIIIGMIFLVKYCYNNQDI